MARLALAATLVLATALAAAPLQAQTACPMLDYASFATIHVASKDTAHWTPGAPGLATWEGGTLVFTADGVATGGAGAYGSSSAEDSACGLAGIAAAGLLASARQ